ncbi:hypothetical protein K439DRAFT_1617880 [Ramaria rubella]|nr:hypothetical protein K439DRAFT_1617880 [Ramaria rubella]
MADQENPMLPVGFKEYPPSYSSSDIPLTYHQKIVTPSNLVEGLPHNFLVGKSNIAPLIFATTMLAHLCLLAAFYTLECSISASSDLAGSTAPSLLGVVRWRVFVHQAVSRFGSNV